MRKSIYAYISIVILAIMEIAGDFSVKEYVSSQSITYLFYGIASYLGVVFFLIQSLIYGKTILYVNAVWDGTSAILESLAAWIILGERFETTREYIGLLFIIMGLFLLG